MNTNFTFSWAEAAIDRIYNCTNLRTAITTTAGYLTDIVDELFRLNGVENGDAEYHSYIDELIECLDDDAARESRDLWEAAGKILQIYALLPVLEEWEVEHEATQRLAPYIDPKSDLLDGVWALLGNMIAHHQGWVEGELTGLEVGIEHELMLQKEWPASFPEDRPPDGLDAYSNVGEE